jgi:hypothetical protein
VVSGWLPGGLRVVSESAPGGFRVGSELTTDGFRAVFGVGFPVGSGSAPGGYRVRFPFLISEKSGSSFISSVVLISSSWHVPLSLI